MKEIFIATKNEGKIKEFKNLLSSFNVNILSIKDFSSIIEPEENGKTFEENSIIKAKYYNKHLGLPCISDDSGLCINSLNGFPSIYSARINGTNKDYLNTFNFIKILLEYNNIKDYSARFICNLTFCGNNIIKSFEGVINGKIDFNIKGENGFGYDPIFIPDGYNKKFSEMTIEEKNKISHRSIALSSFVKWFKNYEK